MKQYIEQLLKGCEKWRVESFIRQVEGFKRDVTTNQAEMFVMDAAAEARRILREMPPTD